MSQLITENPNIAKPMLGFGSLRKAVAATSSTSRAREVKKAATGPMPFALITGAVSFPSSWTDAKGRAAALNRRVAVIARETGRHFDTHTERSAAEAFARSHRLSIANAFERRLCRKDVVEALVRLYAERKKFGET